MRNSETTKELILHKSGLLFNKHGYKATSLSDITKSTGLTKGAIYRHFKNKEKLEVETLMHLAAIMFEKERVCIKAANTAPAKLRAMTRFFESYISNPPIPGGCPLLNAAIESDDTDPRLKKKARVILDVLRGSLVTVLRNGIKYGQLRKNIDVAYYTTVFIASLEGAIMMSKLSGNDHDIRIVVKHLDNLIKDIEA